MDSVPLTHTDGVCASVADWRKGACTAYPVTVDIPFAIAGDFVYHCHILEHEDGGMMARIEFGQIASQGASREPARKPISCAERSTASLIRLRPLLVVVARLGSIRFRAGSS